jgi:predicted transcriptional regulator
MHYRVNEEKMAELIENYIRKNPEQKEKSKTASPEVSLDYMRKITPEIVEELARQLGTTTKCVKERCQDVIDYCESSGRRYKNYKAALRNFIKSHLEKHPEARAAQAKQVYVPKNEAPRSKEEQERIERKIAETRRSLTDKFKMPI